MTILCILNKRFYLNGPFLSHNVLGALIVDKKIDVIPAVPKTIGKNKVGIYCRASSSSSAQLHSLANQASWLTRYVAGRPDWFLADIYLDVESGASPTGRVEYNRMMEDAKRGLIKVIVVKSISRFGRDTDSILEATRALKAVGVAVFFEEQGIDSRSPDSELYISIYAAVAQAENFNLSENIKWGIRKRIEDGSSRIFDRPCYGYRLDDDHEFAIVPEDASVVRRIYGWYLDGMSVVKIKDALEKEKIKSPSGKDAWSKHTIELILTNKKYCGFSVVYKTYLTGEPKTKRKTNKGEHMMVEMANHHEAIIPLELFERVQAEKASRSNIEIDDNGTPRRRSTKYSAAKSSENAD